MDSLAEKEFDFSITLSKDNESISANSFQIRY